MGKLSVNLGERLLRYERVQVLMMYLRWLLRGRIVKIRGGSLVCLSPDVRPEEMLSRLPTWLLKWRVSGWMRNGKFEPLLLKAEFWFRRRRPHLPLRLRLRLLFNGCMLTFLL